MSENERVKTGLIYCTSDRTVSDGACPYSKNCDDCDGIQVLKKDALLAIIRLEAEVKTLKAERAMRLNPNGAANRDMEEKK